SREGPDMGGYDPFVASPAWGHYIIWHFFLVGPAAGSYAGACMVRLGGYEPSRRAARPDYDLPAALVAVAGVLSVARVVRRERFWHMLIQSNTFRPMLKWWSPMSAGSWALSAFGAFSGVSFAAAVVEDDWFGLGRFRRITDRLTRGKVGALMALGGLISAFF